MSVKLNIGFVWQGFNGVYGRWNDGLKGAMNIIEKHHNVTYHEPNEDLADKDVILYWEAPCTAAGKDRNNYENIRNTPTKKILLFAGGPIKREWCEGFDIFCVESKINEEEFEALGLPWMRAFGVNTDIMRPEKQPRVFDGVFPSTCASWKRQGLFSRALGAKGVICGRGQPEDPHGFLEARKNGVLLFDELPYHAVNTLYNSSVACVNTSDYWGGGQRTTLEAMATNTPPIVMSDSIKNREYVEESGYGIIVEPNEHEITRAIEEIKTWDEEKRSKGRGYVLSKWSHEHYATNLLKAIEHVSNKS